MSSKPLSIKEFKNWLVNQQNAATFFNINRDQDDPNEELIGKIAKSKVSEHKLLERIETDDDPVVLVQEFLENGGSVLAIRDKKIEVEVESGEFTIPRFCVRIKKD